MKVLVAFLALLTVSAHAQDFSQKRLKNVLKIATCELKIVQKPVVFGKDRAHALSHHLVFTAHETSSDLRRLKRNRILKINSVGNKQILVDDASVLSLCVLDNEKNRCSGNLRQLTVSEIEEQSGGNIKISCKIDPIRDI
jgi:hypothetical protein